jgi:hypothetical protein
MFVLLTAYSTVGRNFFGKKFTRLEVELMTDATLGTAVVDDLFGIRPVAPTSRYRNADVRILDGRQRNVVVVVDVIKLVPPRNVVEILLDVVAQPPQVGVLPL